MFDYNKDVTIVGAVKELQWTNGISRAERLEASDAKGGPATY